MAGVNAAIAFGGGKSICCGVGILDLGAWTRTLRARFYRGYLAAMLGIVPYMGTKLGSEPCTESSMS
eukprot:738953-Amphidinium_carterae.1